MTTDPEGIRIAMWSGPRNISTAMMRSWGNRPDTWVCDEPLYAHYLHRTRLEHPGAREVVENGETDWRAVAGRLTGTVPRNRAIFYQKHMAHHLLPNIDRTWLDSLTHGFLIRDPEEMLTSLGRVLREPTLEDTGLPQQIGIFEQIRARTGTTPPVVDARDVLGDPEGLLRALCRAFGVPFLYEMLSWPPGPRETDGIWARYWYASVERSTGFRPPTRGTDPLPESLRPLLGRCLGYYERLHEQRLRAE